MNIQGNFGNGNSLVLSVSNWDWQNPPANGVLEKIYDTHLTGTNMACQEISGSNLCDRAMGQYINDLIHDATISDTISGYIQITLCDTVNKKVSGRFSFITTDLNQTMYDTIQGSFANQPYTVHW